MGMGLYHTIQAPVEGGLVHVDIALPDYKIAFFLEGAAPSTSPGGVSNDPRGAPRRGEGLGSSFLGPDGSALTGCGFFFFLSFLLF